MIIYDFSGLPFYLNLPFALSLFADNGDSWKNDSVVGEKKRAYIFLFSHTSWVLFSSAMDLLSGSASER